MRKFLGWVVRWWRRRRNLKRFAKQQSVIDPDDDTKLRPDLPKVKWQKKTETEAEDDRKAEVFKAIKARIRAALREYRGFNCETCRAKLIHAAYTRVRWCSERCRLIAKHARAAGIRRIPYEKTTKGRRVMRAVTIGGNPK